MKTGFSLVELSIVLVILGLLTGGILAGQSLIRASELRAVTSEFDRYQAAVNTFRDKYFANPGDFRDATKFWNRQINAAHCVTNSGVATINAASGACDGNGDGILNSPGAASQSGEIFQFWRQLAFAGLIEGSYTGLADAGGNIDGTPGSNLPRSKLTRGAWTAYYVGNHAGDANWYQGNFGNMYYFGGDVVNQVTYERILKPEEVWNIDMKMDDGKPGTGKVITFWRASCSTSTSVTDYAAGYQLNNNSMDCATFFSNIF